MTATPPLDPTQTRVLIDLQNALDGFASAPQDDAALFDLLGTLGQARRLGRLVPRSDAVSDAIRAAEGMLAKAPMPLSHCFRALRRDALLDALAAALIDEEPEPAFDAMFDLDLTLCALETASLHDAAESLRNEAVDTARLCAEPAPKLLRFASRFLTSLGTDSGAAAVWDAIAASAHRSDVEFEDAPEPPWLAPMLSADPLAGVLRLVPHLPAGSASGNEDEHPAMSHRALRAVASMGGVSPSMAVLALDRESGWELTQRDAGAEQQIVLRWLEGPGPNFVARVTSTAVAIEAVRANTGNEAYFVCPAGVEITVTVGDRDIRVLGPA